MDPENKREADMHSIDRGTSAGSCHRVQKSYRDEGMELYSAYADFLRAGAIALASIKHDRVMGILAVGKGTVSKREAGKKVN